LAGAFGSPQLAKVQELQKQLWDSGDGRPPRELREQYEAELDKLPEAQREQVRQEDRRRMMKPFQDRIDRYFALPAGPQRKAELDKQIKEFEDLWKRREERRQERDRDGKKNASRERGGPNGGQGGKGQARGGDGRDRSVRMRDRLASTSPEQRAKMAEYRRAIEERRKELGLPTRPRWGGFR
jgi:hypothetical protein